LGPANGDAVKSARPEPEGGADQGTGRRLRGRGAVAGGAGQARRFRVGKQ
jgi:hypothetical protein